MLAAKKTLTEASGGRIVVDAAVARHVDQDLDVLQRYRDAGHLKNVAAVIVHFGTNGPFSARQFERLVALTEGVPRVVVINVFVPRRWEAESNATVARGVPGVPTMRLADWYSAAPEPGVLSTDHVHPTSYGARVYSRLVLEQLQDVQQPPPPPPPPPPSTTTTTTTPPPPTTEPPESTTTSSTSSTTTTAPPSSTSSSVP